MNHLGDNLYVGSNGLNFVSKFIGLGTANWWLVASWVVWPISGGFKCFKHEWINFSMSSMGCHPKPMVPMVFLHQHFGDDPTGCCSQGQCQIGAALSHWDKAFGCSMTIQSIRDEHNPGVYHIFFHIFPWFHIYFIWSFFFVTAPLAAVFMELIWWKRVHRIRPR